ncbi:MAG: nucleotidyl transferase AbiEii/AbiGii toxin family protein [Candidatus Nitrosotalea sp.]|nr:nucleotidyl transferase AbiEii/AbiGii toxin family protein [Candidatus Nitrosotalea sp.]
MIRDQILRKLSRDWKVGLNEIEKHYVLGWILYGIVKSSIAKNLAFKGGTALSKIYFPSDWRLSEDLDFSILGETEWDEIIKSLENEVPSIVQTESGMVLRQKEDPHTNAGYLQYKIGYIGPIGRGIAKIEVTREKFVGYVVTGEVKNIPSEFDYPKFSVNAYSLETIMSEKIRAIMERGYLRDYYDVWRLLKEKKFEKQKVLDMFKEKCKVKGIVFSNVEQFFPEGIVEKLRPHIDTGLVRLSREPLPDLDIMIKETRDLLKKLLQ